MIQNEENRVVEHSPFNRVQRIAETIAFHQERASFWSRCAEMAKDPFSKAKRKAFARRHALEAKNLEFDLNDNQ